MIIFLLLPQLQKKEPTHFWIIHVSAWFGGFGGFGFFLFIFVFCFCFSVCLVFYVWINQFTYINYLYLNKSMTVSWIHLVQDEITDEEDKDILRQHDVKFGPPVNDNNYPPRKRKHHENNRYVMNCTCIKLSWYNTGTCNFN